MDTNRVFWVFERVGDAGFWLHLQGDNVGAVTNRVAFESPPPLVVFGTGVESVGIALHGLPIAPTLPASQFVEAATEFDRQSRPQLLLECPALVAREVTLLKALCFFQESVDKADFVQFTYEFAMEELTAAQEIVRVVDAALVENTFQEGHAKIVAA